MNNLGIPALDLRSPIDSEADYESNSAPGSATPVLPFPPGSPDELVWKHLDSLMAYYKSHKKARDGFDGKARKVELSNAIDNIFVLLTNASNLDKDMLFQ